MNIVQLSILLSLLSSFYPSIYGYPYGSNFSVYMCVNMFTHTDTFIIGSSYLVYFLSQIMKSTFLGYCIIFPQSASNKYLHINYSHYTLKISNSCFFSTDGAITFSWWCQIWAFLLFVCLIYVHSRWFSHFWAVLPKPYWIFPLQHVCIHLTLPFQRHTYPSLSQLSQEMQ